MLHQVEILDGYFPPLGSANGEFWILACASRQIRSG